MKRKEDGGPAAQYDARWIERAGRSLSHNDRSIWNADPNPTQTLTAHAPRLTSFVCPPVGLTFYHLLLAGVHQLWNPTPRALDTMMVTAATEFECRRELTSPQVCSRLRHHRQRPDIGTPGYTVSLTRLPSDANTLRGGHRDWVGSRATDRTWGDPVVVILRFPSCAYPRL